MEREKNVERCVHPRDVSTTSDVNANFRDQTS